MENYNLKNLNINFYKNLVNDSYVKFSFDNSFCVFNSINCILYLIYAKENKSLISYDLINNQKLTEIKNAHNNYISSFRHYTDNSSLRDLIMSISAEDNNIKIWDIIDFHCILDIKNVNKNGTLLSACFLNDYNKIYIITSNRNWVNIEPIKVYDLKGNKTKEINNFNINIFFIDNFYDIKSSVNYLVIGCNGYSLSYDYNNNKIYNKYYNHSNTNYYVRSIIIYSNETITKMIESNDKGLLNIWNFHSGKFISKIKICDDYLCGICLWDKDYLFVGCYNKLIKLIDISKEVEVNSFINHEHSVITIKKIIHPKYGECLITQGLESDQIKIWITNKK